MCIMGYTSSPQRLLYDLHGIRGGHFFWDLSGCVGITSFVKKSEHWQCSFPLVLGMWSCAMSVSAGRVALPGNAATGVPSSWLPWFCEVFFL